MPPSLLMKSYVFWLYGKNFLPAFGIAPPLVFFLFFSSCGVLHAQAEQCKSREIVSQYKGHFNKPPGHVPSFHVVDGPITGNGDIGLTVGGPPEKQRYWISKNDFWKSGPDFKQCGPSLIGGIDINIADLKEASYNVEQVLYEPVITSKFATKDRAVTINARVLATENLLVFELSVEKKPVQVEINLWAKEGYGSETDKGRDEEVQWVSRAFRTGDLLYPTEATVALKTFPSKKSSFTLEPGQNVTLVAAVMTNHESTRHGHQSREKTKGLNEADIAILQAKHNQWWRNFWAQSFVEVSSTGGSSVSLL